METIGKSWQVERPCPECGRAYIPKLKKQKTCGDRACIVQRQHANKGPKEQRICAQCGQNIIHRKAKRFCSKKCHGRWRVEQNKAKNPPKFTICQNPLCNKPLTHMRSKKGNGWFYDPNMQYCDISCMGQDMALKLKERKGPINLYQYQNGKTPIDRERYVPKMLEGNLNVQEVFGSVLD